MLYFTLRLSGRSKGQGAGEPGSDTDEQVYSDEPGPKLSQEASGRLESSLVGPMAGQSRAVGSWRLALLQCPWGRG